MGLFDKFIKKPQTVREIDGYKPKYDSQCRYIWKNYVPKSGQSNVLQGELLRRVEKLRYEVQNNGNINWDEDFDAFCDFIKEKLCDLPYFSRREKKNIAAVTDRIKNCGRYSIRYFTGEISDEEVDPARMAYIDDDIYDFLADAVGRFQSEHPEPVPYTPDESIRR